MSTTEAPALTRPDLPALLESDPETVAHILCAEFGGATWEYGKPAGRRERWYLAGEDRDYILFWTQNGEAHADAQASLPRPLHDDGDAWRLMVRDGLWLEPVHDEAENVVGWEGLYQWRGESFGTGQRESARTAAVIAALYRAQLLHAHLSELISSVIERLEQAHGSD